MTENTNENEKSQDSTEKAYSASEYNKAIERARNFESKLANLEKEMEKYSSVDIEKLKADSQALYDMQKQNAGDPDQIDRLVTQKVGEFKEQWQKDKEKIQNLKSKITELTVTDKVYSQMEGDFVKSPLVRETLKNLIRQNCKLTEEGKIAVIDKDGRPRIKPDSAMQEMQVSDWIEEIKKQNPEIALDKSPSGAKMKGETRSTTANGKDYKNLTYEELMLLPMDEVKNIPADAVRKFFK